MPLQPQFATFAKDAMAAIQDVTKKAGGPQTPEGKAASAMNALKHGLSGNTVAVPGENPAVYEQILLDLRRDHRPRTTGEDQCIEQMAMAYWKQVRAAKLETAIWDIETEDATAEKSSFHKMAASFLTDSSASRALDKTTRYPSALARNAPPVLAKSDPGEEPTMKGHAPEETLSDLPAVVRAGPASRRPPTSLR